MHAFAAARVMIQDTSAYRPNLALEYPNGLTDVCGALLGWQLVELSERIPVRCTSYIIKNLALLYKNRLTWGPTPWYKFRPWGRGVGWSIMTLRGPRSPLRAQRRH